MPDTEPADASGAMDAGPAPAFQTRAMHPRSHALKCLFIAALMTLPAGLRGNDTPPSPMGAIIADDLAFAAQQYEGLLARVRPHAGLPRSFRNGRVVMVPPEDWTSGFFAGSLWLLFEATSNERWARAAREYTGRLERIRHHTGTHDVGFMLNCSFGQGLRLTGDEGYRAVLLDGAEALASRFNPAVGATRSWNSDPKDFLVIVDNMMNLELLTWAARAGNRPHLREIAIRHANTTLAHHYRPDGSSWHVVNFDPATGNVQEKRTRQGAADDSAWARGQSWGLYGLTMMYRETRRPDYLEQALKIAEFLRNHPRLPKDGIPHWDYDAPGIPYVPRDASAAAIMASALLELCTFAPPDAADAYRALAERQLRSLSSPEYRAPLGENGNFLLMHGVGHFGEWSEVDVPLVYADYYFLEALLRFRAQLEPSDGV